MKKILFFTFLFTLICKMGFAQNELKYVGAMHRVDSFLNRYLQYSTFSKVGDNQINDLIIEKYKKMFSPGILVVDENCPAYYDGNYRHPYELKERPISEICNYVKNTFSEGMSVKLLNANIDYSNLISNQVNVVLKKQLKGKTITGLRIVNNDTIELQITFSADFEKLQITNTKLIGHTISFLNDVDGDFVCDEKDKCKLKRGFKDPDGCPSADEKQEAEALAMELRKKEKERKISDQAFDDEIRADKSEAEKAAEQAHLQQIASIKDANEKRLAAIKFSRDSAYNALPQQPKIYFGLDLFAGSPKVNSYLFNSELSSTFDQSASFINNKNSKPVFANLTSVGVQANMEYYFRKQAHWGVGLSLQYQITKGEISKSDFNVNYKAVDIWGNSYRRHVLATAGNSLKENFTLNQFSVPLLFKYKNNFSKKIGFELEAGVNIILSAKAVSKLDDNIKFDYEATYHFGNADAKNYFSLYDINNADWIISASQSARSGASTPSEYFNGLQKEGYDLGLSQAPTNITSNSKFIPSLGYIFHPSLTYKDNDNIILNLGLMLMSQQLINKFDVSSYYLTNKMGEYNTMLNGIDQIKTNFSAVTIGIKYAIQPQSQPK